MEMRRQGHKIVGVVVHVVSAAGHPRQLSHPDILSKLTNEANLGRLRFPLSAVHYIELTENPRDKQRREAAEVMAPLSRFMTMAPIGRIIDEELARELNKRYGRPAFPTKVPKFGSGVRYAFGETTDPEEQFDEIKERLLLEGPPQAIRSQIPNYDANSARRIADAELESFNVMHTTLRIDPHIAARPLDAICARQLMVDILDNWTRALHSAGRIWGLVGLFCGENWSKRTLSGPTSCASLRMRAAKLT
jgi:hypothetical protein